MCSHEKAASHRRKPKVMRTSLMKKIEAIIPAFKLYDVLEALKSISFDDFNTLEVKETGLGAKHHQLFGAELSIDYREVVKLEAVCDDLGAPLVTQTILQAGDSGRTRSASVTVYALDRVVEF